MEIRFVLLTTLLAISFGLWLGWFLRSRKEPKIGERWWSNLFKTNKDFDGSVLLFGMISLCHIVLLSLLLLEIMSFFVAKETMLIFTPEINHTLLTVTIAALVGWGGFFFGRQKGMEENMKQQEVKSQ